MLACRGQGGAAGGICGGREAGAADHLASSSGRGAARRDSPPCPATGCSCTPAQPMRVAVSMTLVCAVSMARTSGLSTRSAIHSRRRSVPCCGGTAWGAREARTRPPRTARPDQPRMQRPMRHALGALPPLAATPHAPPLHARIGPAAPAAPACSPELTAPPCRQWPPAPQPCLWAPSTACAGSTQRARGSGRHGTMGRAAAWRGTKPTPRAAGCPGARPTATPIHGCGPQRGRGAAQAHAAAGAVPLCCLRRRGRRDAAFKLILCWARAHGQHMRVEAAQGSKPAPALRRPRRAKAVAAAAAAGVAERGRCSPARGAAAQES